MSGFGQPPGGAGGFGAPMGGQGAPPMGGQGAPPGEAPNFTLWLIVPIVSAALCGNVLFGAVAAVLAYLGKQEWDQGQYESAQSKLKISKILTIASCALFALVILLYVVFALVGAGFWAMNAPPS